MRDIKIKVCGIRNIDIANHCVLEGAQFLGFVFYENSPRYVSLKSAGKIVEHSLSKFESSIIKLLEYTFKSHG